MKFRCCGHETCLCKEHKQMFSLSPEAQAVADAQYVSDHLSREFLYYFAAKVEAAVKLTCPNCGEKTADRERKPQPKCTEGLNGRECSKGENNAHTERCGNCF